MKSLNNSTESFLAIMVFVVFISAAGSCSSEPPLKGKVVRVTDGDTVVLLPGKSNNRITCRLYGIDAPETGKRQRRSQPYADEAGRELEKLILGEIVEFTTTGEKTHNREVCIIRRNSMDINLEMVKMGYAWAYRKHLKAPYASEYIEAENAARAQKSGIWQQPNPLPPWEFKRRYWKR